MSAKSHLVRVLYATAELNAFVAEVTAEGAVAFCVGIRCGAISSDMKLSS
jgi:hypothetical protein